MTRSSKWEVVLSRTPGLSSQFALGAQRWGSVYYYEFACDSRKFPALGTPHALELRFVFNRLQDADERPHDQELAERMAAYWVQFAVSGNPNHSDAPHWPSHEPMEKLFLRLDHMITVGQDLHGVSCDFLDKASEGI